VQGVRTDVYAAAFDQHYLQPEVPTEDRQTERPEEMGESRSAQDVSELRQGISVRTAPADDMQSLMRESHGMEEEIRRAMSDRTKRLGRLGNAVVPQCAQWLGERILAIHQDVE